MKKLFGLLSAAIFYSSTAFAAVTDDQKITLALKYAKSNEWDKAYTQAKSSSSPKLASSLVKFKELSSGKSPVSSFVSFHKENPWFPICKFDRDIEKKITTTSTATDISKWFKLCAPKSETAKFLDSFAELTLNKTTPTKKFYEEWARITNLNTALDQQIYNTYRKQISSFILTKKVQAFIWQGNYEQATYYSKFLPLNDQKMTKLKISFANNLSSYDALIKRYPSLKNDEFVQFKHIAKLLKERKDDEAYKEFTQVKHFSSPEKWWRPKHTITRNFVREKQYKKAYRIAISHNTKTGDEYQEAEWIAGWIAFKFLNNPKAAANHFYNSYADCQYSSCKSRAAYWLAKSYKKLNDTKKMEAWYDTAARHKMHFYGILAITEHPKPLERKVFDTIPAKNIQANTIPVNVQNLVKATYYMNQSGNAHIARTLSRYIAESNVDPAVKYLVAENISKDKLSPLRIQYSKFLANHKGPFLETGYPTNIPIYNNKNSKALYLAIIRQESNFDPSARSPAGAIGLMQLIPSTAKRFAKALGLPHNAFRTDPKANVAKGVSYLDSLVEYFGNVAPAIAAYNAGEKAVERWIKEFGNPALMSTKEEVLDWVESIPYAETRTYVKKVLENMIVYENILKSDKPQLLASLLGK